jgi:hypothetical protein
VAALLARRGRAGAGAAGVVAVPIDLPFTKQQ